MTTLDEPTCAFRGSWGQATPRLFLPTYPLMQPQTLSYPAQPRTPSNLTDWLPTKAFRLELAELDGLLEHIKLLSLVGQP